MSKSTQSTALRCAVMAVCLGLTACASISPTHSSQTSQDTAQTAALPNELRFDPDHYQPITIDVDGQTIHVRAYEHIAYAMHPAEPDYQVMNIYIPEPYFVGQSVNGYTKDTAPIFFANSVGGYMPAKPVAPSLDKDGKPNSLVTALSRGYVAVSSGARGRTMNTGKAPAAIVDLKAAIRYLKANDALMAGRTDRIISNGTSAGGAMSLLLGASGGSHDYDNKLAKLGAIMQLGDAPIDDAVFAVSAYAPITHLEHADAAYEWQFHGVDEYQKMSVSMLDYHIKRERTKAVLSDDEKQWSAQLKQNFPNHINSLNLIGHDGQALRLNANGNGSFKDEVLYHLNRSANTAFKQGVDLNDLDFLAQSKSKNPYYIADFDGFIRHMGRGKGVPAFDAIDLSSGENELFGSTTTARRHFTDFAKQYGQGVMADAATIRLMNPMNYLADSPTQYWRIRHGTKDNDTSLAIPVILATSLSNHGKQVDFAMPWGVEHRGDYDLVELFDWIDHIVKQQDKP